MQQGRTVTQSELHAHTSRVLKDVEEHGPVVVTRNGIPVVEIRPVGRAESPFRPVSVLLELTPARIDAEKFFADIDRYVDQDPTLPADRSDEEHES